jgi:hypothetical protein
MIDLIETQPLHDHVTSNQEVLTDKVGCLLNGIHVVYTACTQIK